MEISEMARNHELLFRFVGMGLTAVYFGGLALLMRSERARRMVQLLTIFGVIAMVSYFLWLNTLPSKPL